MRLKNVYDLFSSISLDHFFFFRSIGESKMFRCYFFLSCFLLYKSGKGVKEKMWTLYAVKMMFDDEVLIYSGWGAASPGSPSSPAVSDVQRVRLSRSNCMISVESL